MQLTILTQLCEFHNRLSAVKIQKLNKNVKISASKKKKAESNHIYRKQNYFHQFLSTCRPHKVFRYTLLFSLTFSKDSPKGLMIVIKT